MHAAADKQLDSRLGRGFTLGDLRVDPEAGEVAGPAGREHLDPKVMGVLVVLAEHAGHVVSREDLQARLWPNLVVTGDALSRCLYELRRQLSAASGGEDARVIVETLPKRGYRLNAEIEPIEPPAAAAGTGTRWKRRVGWALVAVVAAAGAILAARIDAPRPVTSIAVLPFDDMSESQDQAYLADGFAEEILDKLNQSTNLRVIARTSSFALRGKDMDVAAVARKLKVTHVLEGSVRKSGDMVRVTAQLIATADSSHLWSSTFERRLGDLFAIQDEIATAVASALRATLDLGDSPARPGPSMEAYDLVKRGEFFYYRRTPGDLERSIGLFGRAVGVDPTYARAWADLAGAYSMKAWSTDPPSRLYQARQGDAAHRAVELDPSLGLAHARLAQYYTQSGDEEASRRHYDRALELDPEDPLILGYKATDAVEAGDYTTAIELQTRAVLRDPLNTVVRQNLGYMLISAGRLDEALDNYRALLEINPDVTADFEIEVPRILVLQGRLDDAAEAAMQLPPGKYRDQAMALLHALPGRRAEADAALRRLEAYVPAPPQDTPDHTVMDSVRLAEIYAFRGMSDRAFATLSAELESLLQRSERRRYAWYLRYEARVAPFLKPLHADPRWPAFMAPEE
jgi:TolB-like protein/DNA-binding winged helix-turn-helix (wHTH) protein/Flp pilus assembly protein TadD